MSRVSKYRIGNAQSIAAAEYTGHRTAALAQADLTMSVRKILSVFGKLTATGKSRRSNQLTAEMPEWQRDDLGINEFGQNHIK